MYAKHYRTITKKKKSKVLKYCQKKKVNPMQFLFTRCRIVENIGSNYETKIVLLALF